jgi:iturin family lipopeptide synthetase A
MSSPSKLTLLNQATTELQGPDQILEQIRQQKRAVQTGLTIGTLDNIAAILKEHPAIDDAIVAIKEDVSGVERLVAYSVADPQRSPVLNGMPRYILPNSMPIVYYRDGYDEESLNRGRHDVEWLIREIFEERLYFKHGIVVHDGDCIFDVGASIGLFSLIVQQLCPNSRIYAFEPAPSIFEILRLNTSLYASENVSLFDFGLADASREDTFTFYPQSPLLSGYHADDQHYLSGPWLMEAPPIEKISSRTRSLSDVLRENAIERIHLLKIDTEGAELAILKGINPEDYARIEQIVMEVHSEALLEQVTAVLSEHGYTLAVEENKNLTESGQAWTTEYMLYAAQKANAERPSRGKRAAGFDTPLPIILCEPLLSKDEVYGFLQERLPYDMTPSAFVFMSDLPRDHEGEIVDRHALPVPTEADLINSDYSDHGFVAPRTAMEKELADIWAELLGLERVGIYDDFFRLGGDSILAANILSRVQETFQIQVPIDLLFEDTFTIARLSNAFEQYQIEQADPEDISAMLAELNDLSDEEVRALLAEE